jgi:DNA-binding response OmpR family regulator
VPRVLVVEDELHIAEGIVFNLEAEGFEVDHVSAGDQAVLRASEVAFDLVLLDVMLPGLSGFEVARKLRASGNYVPILILTAKDEASDLIRGIEEGADDYLTKPFTLDELLVRVRALLRRRRWDRVPNDQEAAPPECFGDVTVRFDRFELQRRDEVIRLTTRETGLLRALVDREGEVVHRGELLESVWGLRPETRTRVVDTFIHRLRRYVEADPSRPRHIVSVRGHGYRFVRGNSPDDGTWQATETDGRDVSS